MGNLATKPLTNQEIILGTVEYSISLTKEEKINNFLDGINKDRAMIKDILLNVKDLTLRLEKISWLKDITQDELALIKTCLIITNKVVKALNKTYAVFNSRLRPNGVCKDELNEFIKSIRDLNETKEDVNLAYFTLPNDKENLKLDKDIAELI